MNKPVQANTNKSDTDSVTLTSPACSISTEQIFEQLKSTQSGLSQNEASLRLAQYGPNLLPEILPPGLITTFIRQFKSPLIYVLVVAALLSLSIKEWSDAGFIVAVLLLNGIIGTIQEYSAQHAAKALSGLVKTSCKVLRANDTYEISASNLVAGDLVLVESGDRVPADMRLLNSFDLEIDESLLTGESLSVLKNAHQPCDTETILSDRLNMLHAGSIVSRGRGMGIVVATGLKTELGKIAESVLKRSAIKAPLLIRMERFTHIVAIVVAVLALLMAAIALYQGKEMTEVFLLAVALAVSAIPEGLPVALTVALAIGMQRMAKKNVIVRELVAVESLGSCTFIATDKTGTLTANQLTAKQIVFPDQIVWDITGSSLSPDGDIIPTVKIKSDLREQLLRPVCTTAVLTNDAVLFHRDSQWEHHGDAVDVALLIMARKAGINQPEALNEYPQLASIPFESERLYSASLNASGQYQSIHVKGAIEKVLPMCRQMLTMKGVVPINEQLIVEQLEKMASDGYRVLALASGETQLKQTDTLFENDLKDLTLLALVGMIDPLREDADLAINRCKQAGIEVAMITGDHPVTARAIARQLKLSGEQMQLVTGSQLKQATNEAAIDELTRSARVFARIEPQQKLDIVQSLQRQGHFVAVSGDGANDAPALKAAHVGVAMGKSGTDVARETAELIITDDNFSSIVSGIEEGRVAYANVRKVIFLLISTGMAELVLFFLSLIYAVPLPLLAVQLLWLNLVTNGIQDIALAFEPAEGDELEKPPRPPQERIFNHLMIERVLISAITIGIVAFIIYKTLLDSGYELDQARNATLLLMVLFENIHVLNSRSETRSVFSQNFFSNPMLLFGTIAAQLIHIGAMYTPWLKDVLRLEPVSPESWFTLLSVALIILVVMEFHKRIKVNRS